MCILEASSSIPMGVQSQKRGCSLSERESCGGTEDTGERGVGEVGGEEKLDATGGTTWSPPGRWCSCTGKRTVEGTEGRLKESRLYPLMGDSGGVRSGGASGMEEGSKEPNFCGGTGEEGLLLSNMLMDSGGWSELEECMVSGSVSAALGNEDDEELGHNMKET